MTQDSERWARYKEETDTYHELEKMQKSLVCAECAGALTLIWEGKYKLKCGNDREHKGYEKPQMGPRPIYFKMRKHVEKV